MNDLRAKQYMPFDALEGYMTEVNKRNVIYIEKPTISIDMAEEIDYKLRLIKKGDIISLKYYKNGSIIHITGEILKINLVYRNILVNKKTIKFDDILEIY